MIFGHIVDKLRTLSQVKLRYYDGLTQEYVFIEVLILLY